MDDEKSRILVVDDDAQLLKSMARILARADREIELAASVARALECLDCGAFDAVIADIRMPGSSGVELLKSARERDPSLQVILLTGWPDVASASRAVEYGAFQYLTKPVEIGQLRGVVDRAVRVTHGLRDQQRSGDALAASDRSGLEAAFERALGSLWIAHQPIVSARAGDSVAREALLRSDEPTLAQPRLLLHAAERLGRARDLGRLTRDTVARALEPDGVLEFVNLQAEELMDPALYVPKAPLARVASRVVLELMERASLERVTKLEDRIAGLRDLGFRLALGEIGAGYAGLTSFAALDPDFVKLDASLVSGIQLSEMKQKLVGATIELCHDTGKQVIAGGVELAEERDTLIELGCDFLQGYLFGAPVGSST